MYSGTLGFGLSDNFHWGRGYSGTLGFGLSDNFHLGGGYSGTLRFRLSDNCPSFWGGILRHSHLDSLTNFNHSSRLMHHRYSTYVETNQGCEKCNQTYFVGLHCGRETFTSTSSGNSQQFQTSMPL